MAVILGIAIYNKVMSVAIYNQDTQDITGTYFFHTQIFEMAFEKLKNYIKAPIVRTVIACTDHFDFAYQQRILEVIMRHPFGKVSFIYHQTASAYYACETYFKDLAVNEIFGVINNHFNVFHLTLYRKTATAGYKPFFVNESSTFDQNFANLALRSRCQNYFVNISNNNLVAKTQKYFNARNVHCTRFDYYNGDGIARGAMIKGIHLDESYPAIINDFLPYPIEIIFNNNIQHVIQPYKEAPFRETSYFGMIEEGTQITIKQQLPHKVENVAVIPVPNKIRYGFVVVSKDEKGIETIAIGKLGNVFTFYKEFWIATGAAVAALSIMFVFLRR